MKKVSRKFKLKNTDEEEKWKMFHTAGVLFMRIGFFGMLNVEP